MKKKRAIRLLSRLKEKYKYALGYPEALEKAIRAIEREMPGKWKP